MTLPLLGATNRTVKRYSRTVSKGIVQRTLVDEFSVNGSLQPMSAREMEVFQEGKKPRAAWCLLTNRSVHLNIGGPFSLDPDELDTEPDVLEYNGRKLHCVGQGDWGDLGGHPLQYQQWIFAEPSTEIEAFVDD